jgi:hypothetical protein
MYFVADKRAGVRGGAGGGGLHGSERGRAFPQLGGLRAAKRHAQNPQAAWRFRCGACLPLPRTASHPCRLPLPLNLPPTPSRPPTHPPPHPPTHPPTPSPQIKEKNPKYSVADVAKECGALWKAIADKDKAKYEELAKKDKERYEKEKAKYNAGK